MGEVKQKKPKMKLNKIYWVDKSFISKNAKASPESSWIMKLKPHCVIVLFLSGIAMYILSFWDFLFIPVSCAAAIFTAFLIIDGIKASIRMYRFNQNLLDRGGEIRNEKNKGINYKVLIKIDKIGVVFFILVVLTLLGINIYYKISNREIFSNFYSQLYFMPMYVSLPSIHPYSQSYLGPVIFMDIDEGVLLGDSVFSYETLTGIRPTDNNGGFEFIQNGQKIAWGTMFSDDLNYLLEMIEIREKYPNYLPE